MQAAWYYLAGGCLLLLNVGLLKHLLRNRAPATQSLRAIFWLQGITGGVLLLAGVVSFL